MKENEAPKKIYLFEGEPILSARSKKREDASIEYTRTDAFIEKVCKFLDDRIKHDSIDYQMATAHLIEDFKNYMKGE